MPKNNESISNIFVRKIVEKGQKLFTKDEIITLWTRSGGSKHRMHYALSLLIGQNILLRVARDTYMSADMNIDLCYWDIVKKLIHIHTPSGAIVGAEKSLELQMMNYSIPEVLVLYTRSTSIRIRLVDGREVHFRTLVSGKKTGMKNLYPIVAKFVFLLDPVKLLVPQKEIALLEALSLREHESGFGEWNVMRFLSKYHDSLDPEVFAQIVKYRYIRAINRLREIAKNEGYESLYRATVDAIRCEGGGCFVKC